MKQSKSNKNLLQDSLSDGKTVKTGLNIPKPIRPQNANNKPIKVMSQAYNNWHVGVRGKKPPAVGAVLKKEIEDSGAIQDSDEERRKHDATLVVDFPM